MFDLDQEIHNWRKKIEPRLPQQTDTIAELESHLRDAFQKHIEQAATPEVAWRLAVQDLGDTEAIAAEFKKLPSPRLISWPSVRVMLGIYGVLVLLATSMMKMASHVRHDTLLIVHTWMILMGYAAVLAFGIFSSWIIIWLACRGWSETEHELYMRATCGAMIAAFILNAFGVFLGGIWFRNHEHQLWIFDWREMGGIAVVAANLLAVLVTIRYRSTAWAMRFSLINVAIVLAAWILPAFWVPLNEYGRHGTFFGIATGSCTVVIILVGLTLVEPGQFRLARE